tara:strand:- start:376 stop:867 length:492 start_codon:yes stop_codon:yes gene_type:complete
MNGSDAPYWEDPVFRYLSRLQRDGREETVPDMDEVLQGLIDGTLDEDRSAELAAEASAERKQMKVERKKKLRIPPDGTRAQLNTAELKKRIYNQLVSKENTIKAIEALPPFGREALLEGLSPGLKRKLGKYLTSLNGANHEDTKTRSASTGLRRSNGSHPRFC